jgi:hypothetical protein
MVEKKSLSYQEISGMKPSKLKKLAEEGMLDDETLTPIRHLGRFFERVGRAALKPN